MCVHVSPPQHNGDQSWQGRTIERPFIVIFQHIHGGKSEHSGTLFRLFEHKDPGVKRTAVGRGGCGGGRQMVGLPSARARARAQRSCNALFTFFSALPLTRPGLCGAAGRFRVGIGSPLPLCRAERRAPPGMASVATTEARHFRPFLPPRPSKEVLCVCCGAKVLRGYTLRVWHRYQGRRRGGRGRAIARNHGADVAVSCPRITCSNSHASLPTQQSSVPPRTPLFISADLCPPVSMSHPSLLQHAVMQSPSTSMVESPSRGTVGGGGVIFRVKRRREEEPLDALLVAERASKRGSGVSLQSCMDSLSLGLGVQGAEAGDEASGTGGAGGAEGSGENGAGDDMANSSCNSAQHQDSTRKVFKLLGSVPHAMDTEHQQDVAGARSHLADTSVGNVSQLSSPDRGGGMPGSADKVRELIRKMTSGAPKEPPVRAHCTDGAMTRLGVPQIMPRVPRSPQARSGKRSSHASSTSR